MLSFIKGKIADKEENVVIIEANGVGFEINISTNSYLMLPPIGETVCIYTYLHVREDEMSLFGFIDKLEREVFKKLLLVNGVGPKLAITILSGISAAELTVAVASGRSDMLKGIKGVGAKIRDRIVLELKEKMDLSTVQNVNLQSTMFDAVKINDVMQQTINVLSDWGVAMSVAQDTVSKVFEEGDTLETLLAKSFKALGR